MDGADRLSALDAMFLYLENDVQPLHVGSLLIFDGPAPSARALRDEVAARLEAASWHRRRVLFMPLDLGRPIWVDCARVDLDEHLRHTVLAEPGDDAQLRSLVARVMAIRLDVRRPLFQLWQVDGLQGGRWALIAKAHHAMVDGLSGADVLQVLLADEPMNAASARTATPPSPTAARPAPSRARLAVAGGVWVVALPLRAIVLLLRVLRTSRESVRAVRRVRHGLAQVVRPDLRPSVLNGPLGREKLWGWTGAALADVSAVTSAAGCTVNDVFLCAIAGGLRRYLLERGEPLDAMEVRAIVPVSGRSAGQPGRPGNLASAMFVELPVQEADPIGRLEVVTRRTAAQKSEAVATSTAALVRLADHIPATLLARAARAYARAGQRRVNVATSNVPGPLEERYLVGCRLIELVPYVPLAQEVRTSFALVSYAGRLTIGISGDAAALPDLDRLIDAVGSSLGELIDAYGPAADNHDTADPVTAPSGPQPARRRRPPEARHDPSR